MNIAAVEEQTDVLVSAGIRVLQIHRFADTEMKHIERLARWAEFPSGRIIDMGSGTGEVAKVMAQLRPELDFTLINISKGQLTYSPGIRQHHCSFLNVPEPDGAFDGAMFCFSIGHEDHKAALWEAGRLLRKGGVLLIYDMVSLKSIELPGLDYHVEPWISSPRFQLDFYMEPQDRWHIAPEQFAGARAAIWRFIRC